MYRMNHLVLQKEKSQEGNQIHQKIGYQKEDKPQLLHHHRHHHLEIDSQY